jgi:hypothetical protein
MSSATVDSLMGQFDAVSLGFASRLSSLVHGEQVTDYSSGAYQQAMAATSVVYAAVTLGAGAVANEVANGVRGIVGAVTRAARATASTRAGQIQGALSPRTQRSVTTAVTETSQGVRVVTSSEGRLRPAQRAALQPGEVAGAGQRGVHAEVNGVNAAREMGLNPTGVAPSRPACPGCTQAMDELGIPIIGP